MKTNEFLLANRNGDIYVPTVKIFILKQLVKNFNPQIVIYESSIVIKLAKYKPFTVLPFCIICFSLQRIVSGKN